MMVLTLRVRDTRIIKYSHRGRGVFYGYPIEIVVKIDPILFLVLDVRWMGEGLSEEDAIVIDQLFQGWVGCDTLISNPETFPGLVELLPWDQWKAAK